MPKLTPRLVFTTIFLMVIGGLFLVFPSQMATIGTFVLIVVVGLTVVICTATLMTYICFSMAENQWNPKKWKNVTWS